jgi:hypothetical protein
VHPQFDLRGWTWEAATSGGAKPCAILGSTMTARQ